MRKSAKRLLKEMRAAANSTRRVSFGSDPSVGLEYNGVSWNPIVSQSRYDFDIASTPRIAKALDELVNVHASAWLANGQRPMVDYRRVKFYGRGK